MNGAIFLARLGLIGSLALAAAAPAQAPKLTDLRVGNESWHLSMALGDLKASSKGAASSTDRQVYTYGNDAGTILSIIVENVHAPAIMASCRDVFDQRKGQAVAGIVPTNEIQTTRGEAAVQETDLSGAIEGRKFIMHNIFTCRVRGSWYIDVHASRIPYEKGEHDALMALVENVKIVD